MSRGARRRAGARGDLPINAEINVTSLVDVAFTLLVIFMITAPILQGGIEVALPRASVPPLTAQDSPIFVTVQRDGTVFLEETEVAQNEIMTVLPQLLSTGTIERVYVRADSLAPYGAVLQAIGAAAESGVPWSLVGEPVSTGN